MRSFIIVRSADGLRSLIMVNPSHIVKMRELFSSGPKDDKNCARCEITFINGEKLRIIEPMYAVDIMVTMM